MKKRKTVCIIMVLLALIIIPIYLICNSDKYRNIQSTNLSGENIGGVSLMEKYSESDVEKIFGKVTKKTEENNYYNYDYATQQFIVDLKADKDNTIVEIYTGLIDTSLKTNKGITKGSTFADVENSYGSNYLKKKYTDFMGSGNGYWITYVDKNSRAKITFEFNEYNNGNLTNMTLLKY